MIELAPGVAVHEAELVYRSSRSGGPGGQNVNKVATRVELFFDVAASPSLGPEVRERLLLELASRIDRSGRLRVVSSAGRTQAENRRRAFDRLLELIKEALTPTKNRLPTKPPRGAVERRLKEKKVQADKKRGRRPPPEQG